MVDAGVIVAGDGNIGISCDGDQLNLPCFGIDGGNHDNIGATVIIVIAGINAVKDGFPEGLTGFIYRQTIRPECTDPKPPRYDPSRQSCIKIHHKPRQAAQDRQPE